MSIIILLFIDLTHIHTYRKHSIMKLSVMRNECLGLFRWYHTYKICGSKEFLIISFKKCISSSLHVVLCISTDFSCYQTLNCTSSMSWTTPGRWDIHSMHTHIFIDQSPTVLIDRWHTHEIIINIKNNYHDLMLKIVSFFFNEQYPFRMRANFRFPTLLNSLKLFSTPSSCCCCIKFKRNIFCYFKFGSFLRANSK